MIVGCYLHLSDITPCLKGQGLLPLTSKISCFVEASLPWFPFRFGLTASPQAFWTIPQALRYVLRSDVHRFTWFSWSGKWKEKSRLKVQTLMLLPKGAFYFGTHKHDSVFKELYSYHSIACIFCLYVFLRILLCSIAPDILMSPSQGFYGAKR
jgi:hypothetical protein